VDREDKADLPKVDLWDKISVRIEREERSRRIMAEAEQSLSAWWQLIPVRLAWSGAGAVVAGVLVFFMVSSPQTGPQPGGEIGIAGSFQELSNIQPVSLSPEERDLKVLPSVREALAEASAEEPLELDWMRSTGRVHLIHNPNKRMAIIWVNRGGAANPNMATPTMVPGEEGLVVVNHHEPNAIPVANR
jgi:hypothetical protein